MPTVGGGTKGERTPEKPSSLHGKTALVTGATSGLGEATALGLAERGARVILVGRSSEKCQATVRRLSEHVPDASFLPLAADFASLGQVRRLADEVQRMSPRLDVMVNNAGCIRSARMIGEDGFEETWSVNYIAPWVLTRLLVPLMEASAPARIVNVSSECHRFARPTWQDILGAHRYSGFRAYAESKLALLMFTFELARRLSPKRVTANAVHPGLVPTQIAVYEAKTGRWFPRHASAGAYMSPEEGAQTILCAALSRNFSGVTGKYLTHCKVAVPSEIASDAELAARLWQMTEELLQFPEFGRRYDVAVDGRGPLRGSIEPPYHTGHPRRWVEPLPSRR